MHITEATGSAAPKPINHAIGISKKFKAPPNNPVKNAIKNKSDIIGKNNVITGPLGKAGTKDQRIENA